MVAAAAHLVEPTAAFERHHGEGPWWETLDPGFAREPERFDLRRRDRMRAGATSLLDLGIRTAGASLVGALALPFGYHPRRLARALEEEGRYSEAVEAGEPGLFFRPPPQGIPVRARRPRPPYFRPPVGECVDLEFKSPFEPSDPAERDSYLALGQNRTARARLWRHDQHVGRARRTLVCVHGFSADPHWLNEWFFDLPAFYAMGYDVALFTLPFHGRRRELWAPFSGHGFFAGGLTRMNEAFAQAVMDFRVLLDFLLHVHGAPEVGVMGVSLGGYTAALLAALEPRLAFSVPNVPVVSVADLVLEWHPISAAIRALLRRMDRSIEDVRRYLAVHCPLTWAPALERDRLMVIGAVGDRMAPPKHARLLWEHWERPRAHWSVGSHLLHLDRAEYLDRVRAFFAGVGGGSGFPPG